MEQPRSSSSSQVLPPVPPGQAFTHTQPPLSLTLAEWLWLTANGSHCCLRQWRGRVPREPSYLSCNPMKIWYIIPIHILFVVMPKLDLYIHVLVNLTVIFSYPQAIKGASHHVYADQPSIFNEVVDEICDAVDWEYPVICKNKEKLLVCVNRNLII